MTLVRPSPHKYGFSSRAPRLSRKLFNTKRRRRYVGAGFDDDGAYVDANTDVDVEVDADVNVDNAWLAGGQVCGAFDPVSKYACSHAHAWL